MGIFAVDGQPRASIVLGVTSRGLCPRSWVLRESSARGARAKILVYIYRRLGGESKPGNLNGSCMRDSVAGALEFD